jgi:predicted Zn-dependent peptidase
VPSYFPATEQTAGSTRTLLKEPDGSRVVRTVLPTGLRVISESVPGARSVALGVWAGVGSRDETQTSAGAAHFLEHLLFKGTPTRSALQISSDMDAVGGEMNAFTTKELTCFYAKSLPNDLPLAVDILLDITTAPLLAADDIESERSVVLEEISMHEDDASDRANEALHAGVLAKSKLAKPILGTRESISTLSPRVIRGFFGKHYQPSNLVVAAAGDVDHRELLELVDRATEGLEWSWGMSPNPSRARVGRRRKAPESQLHLAHWPGEQCTVAIGTMGLPRGHEDRRTLDVLNEVVGGGMSSRLFQSIREERGLAYSVYSFHVPYSDAGVWGIAAGCSPEAAPGVVQLAKEELERILTAGLYEEEVERAKGRLSGSLVLASEESSARMAALGKAEIATGELHSMADALGRIAAVDTSGANRVARYVLGQPHQVVIVGPHHDLQATQEEYSRLRF